MGPGHAEGGLIGKIGGDSGVNTGGPIFWVGSKVTRHSKSQGRLFLTINDEPSGFGDNHQFIFVKVNVK